MIGNVFAISNPVILSGRTEKCGDNRLGTHAKKSLAPDNVKFFTNFSCTQAGGCLIIVPRAGNTGGRF
jgi:hypothetical protein